MQFSKISFLRLFLISDDVIAKINAEIYPIENPAPLPAQHEDLDDLAPGRDEDVPEMPFRYVLDGDDVPDHEKYELLTEDEEAEDHLQIPPELFDSAEKQLEAAEERLQREREANKAKKKIDKNSRQALLSVSEAIEIYNKTDVSLFFNHFKILLNLYQKLV